MIFDWDDANRNHIAAHNVTPTEAEHALTHLPLDLEVQEDPDDFLRFMQIGETGAGRILVLLSTVRGDAIRIISAWDAPKAYKLFYLSEKARHIWQE
jgi:uncharacterized protein